MSWRAALDSCVDAYQWIGPLARDRFAHFHELAARNHTSRRQAVKALQARPYTNMAELQVVHES